MEDPSLQYVYLPIEDAKKCAEVRVNLFAVVAEIGAVKHSNGTDYVLTLKIVDQSCSASGLVVNFFAEIQSELPHVKSNGDIISLHRVVMGIYNGEHYCVFNKAFSSFALFKGKSDVGLIPYQTSMKYGATCHDDKFLLQLRTWALDHETKGGLDDTSLLLSSIVTGKVIDVVCKVLHVCETAEDNCVIFVWDGTDAPTGSCETDLDLEGETPCLLCPEAFTLSREVLPAFPDVGTVLRIFAGKFLKEKENEHLKKGGHWVRFCNIVCDHLSGLWRGMLEPDSKVCLLSNEDTTVIRRERLYLNRTASEVERLPFMSTPLSFQVTKTDFEDAPYSSLMRSLAHPEVTHKLKCVVRVIAAYPWRGEDLRAPAGHFRFRLTLEDPTARIHAFIYKEDGVYFFGGYPTSDVLTIKMKKLLGIDDGNDGGKHASRNPPWVSCCLKSYYVDKGNPWGTRNYRIFATRLIG